MINYLEGTIKNKGEAYVIVLVNGVGYKVFINSVMWVELDINQPVEFYTYHHIREDQSYLFRFNSLEELNMFEMLLSISGVGPKSALGVLSVGSVLEIKESISMGDPSLLTKVSGIGKKTAERVVLELRDKVGSLPVNANDKAGIMASSDEIDALIALGYNVNQAREALRGVNPKIKDSGERIKEALGSLGK